MSIDISLHILLASVAQRAQYIYMLWNVIDDNSENIFFYYIFLCYYFFCWFFPFFLSSQTEKSANPFNRLSQITQAHKKQSESDNCVYFDANGLY